MDDMSPMLLVVNIMEIQFGISSRGSKSAVHAIAVLLVFISSIILVALHFWLY